MNDEEGNVRRAAHNVPAKKTSMATLVAWNVSKALENNPQLDLRAAIRAAQERLEQTSLDVDAIISRYPEERHLACAILAWQQLGHQSADSLYSFVASNRNEKNSVQQKSPAMKVEKSRSRLDSSTDAPFCFRINAEHSTANLWGLNKSASSGSSPPVGPVLRIPVEPKIVMRMDSHSGCRHGKKTQPAPARDLTDDINAACCLDTECAEKLKSMDEAAAELRARAQMLAKREAERASLLERAEMAWRDLEAGYQRRLRLAEEKEYDVAKQTTKLIEERNGYKSVCTTLVEKLKQGSEAAEAEREQLTELEREVCARACERGRLAEQAARSDAQLADQLCKVAQLDRDLMFKEEQGRRKQLALESEAAAAQALTHEVERALRAELSDLKAQVDQVARDLMTADEETNLLTAELNDIREERNGLAEDLEGCQEMCDGRMKAKMDELKKQREQLLNVKNQHMECRCKMPVDASVEAKRTPSLAALCHCSPEQKLVEPCSCTSLRSRLLTDLLADLFGGLQTHLSGPESQMPCQLLKCLEDKHNWDRATAVKSALRDFFSQLLLGELDIAIATSIENYHAKWVGASCADEARYAAPCGTKHSAGWQERALELKAQKMASKLAEQLFEKKAQELAQQAKNILAKTGRPPCECHPASCCPTPKAVYQCIVKPPTRIPVMPKYDTPPKYLRQTLQDVTYLKTQIEDLKKESIKREDLNVMEEKIAKMVQFASVSSPVSSLQNTYDLTAISLKKDLSNCRPVHSRASGNNENKPIIKRKQMQSYISPKQANKSVSSTISKRPTQQFSVNMCLYNAKKKSSAQHKLIQQLTKKPSPDQNTNRDINSLMSSVGQTNPIMSTSPKISYHDSKASTSPLCAKDCTCFHKTPSNTSIDKLLETLSKWKDDLSDFPENNRTNKKQDNTTSLFKFSQKSSIVQKQEQCEIGDKKNIKNLSKIKSQNTKSLSHSEKALEEPVVKDKDFTSVVIDTQPVVTESVYMAAINLEKSPDHSCRCVNNRNNTDTNNKNTAEFPFKCIKSAKCVCKHDYPTPVHHEQGLDTQSFLFQKIIPTESKTTSYEFSPAYFPPNNKKINIEIGDVMQTCSSVKNIAKCSTSQRIEYDNHIKCLGVTLTNVTSKKNNKSKAKPIDKTIDEIFLYSNGFLDSKKEMYQEKLNLKQKNMEIPHRQRLIKDSYEICQENTRNKANKRSYANHFNSEYESSLVSKDHEGTDQTSKGQHLNTLENESCICCHNIDADDSKDLEVNTFQLIEEHLKGKLDEFKNTFCKSSCIPNAEEEKLFTAILRRIKQLIAESTCSVTCKCAGNSNKVTGSWNRAYSLLQEYLKTKIERVKCHCNSDGKIDDCNVLHNVLKNISYLIESDFQRIKAICKCKNTNLVTTMGHELQNQNRIYSFKNHLADRKMKPTVLERDQVPTSEKENTAESKQKIINEIIKVDSNNPILLARHISAEVLSMETKSCDAMKIDIKYMEVQTVEKGEIENMAGYKDTKNVCDCSSHAEKTKSRLYPDFVIQSNEVRLNDSPFCETETAACPTATTLNVSNKSDTHAEVERLFDEQTLEDKNIISKKSRNASLPYIGYTMDCCCDSNLGCVCTKSTVRALNDRLKIRDIWKTFTNKKTVLQNVSYILNNTADKLLKDVNYVEVTGGAYKKIAPEAKSIHKTKSNVCESTINTQGISLKKSKTSVDIAHETTNTVEHIKNSQTEYTADSSRVWCNVVLTPNVRQSERLSVLKQNKEENLYFPEDIYMKNGSSNAALDKHTSRTSESTCDCKMVPICHVKMLVANIGDKLANAQCTCDSLTSNVCPVHS